MNEELSNPRFISILSGESFYLSFEKVDLTRIKPLIPKRMKREIGGGNISCFIWHFSQITCIEEKEHFMIYKSIYSILSHTRKSDS